MPQACAFERQVLSRLSRKLASSFLDSPLHSLTAPQFRLQKLMSGCEPPSVVFHACSGAFVHLTSCAACGFREPASPIPRELIQGFLQCQPPPQATSLRQNFSHRLCIHHQQKSSLPALRLNIRLVYPYNPLRPYSAVFLGLRLLNFLKTF